MDFSKEILQFMSEKIGGISIIAEGSSEIVYADSYFKNKYGDNIEGMDADYVYMWIDDCPKLSSGGEAVEWEYIDINAKKYYKFNSAMFEKNGKKYHIHLVTDITEYMGLNRDVTKYMAFFRKLSDFQTAVLERLSDTYYELLPLLTGYFKTSKAYFMIQRNDMMDIITYNKMGNIYSNDRIDISPDVERVFENDCESIIPLKDFDKEIQNIFLLGESKDDSTYRLLVNGTVSGQKYAVYLSVWPNMDGDSVNEATLRSVIKLYIENGIMREKLVYESEHDGLTGLYNKGRYLSMSDKEYRNLDSIAVFNFDVNNLKIINDRYGHEAGDKLLIKAANSIRKVTSNKVHAYRVGGDEFLVIAENVSYEETISIKERWENELARLNSQDDETNCVIAVGMVYAEKEYDYETLVKKADELMYEDKKNKKKSGEEIR